MNPKRASIVVNSLILVFACLIMMPFVAQAAQSPVVYFSFDNISGDVVKDLSGFGNDGKMDAGPKVIDAQFGKGVEFANSRVKISASNTLNANLFQGSFTLVVWIKPTLVGNAWQQVFRAFRAADSSDTLFVNVNGTLSWRGRVNNTWAGGMCETAAGLATANKWLHVAVVSDTKNFRVYVGGALAKESAFQKTDGSNVNHYLGGDPPTTGESYSGAVDDFAIYTVALKENEIVSIKDRGVEKGLSVEVKGKLATKWATLKSTF